MKKTKYLLTILLILLFSLAVNAEVQVGQPAPEFELTDSNGKLYKLSNLKGKVVVLEWFNHDCPFVVKHYKSGNMTSLQKKYTDKGITWLAINSGSKDSGSYKDPETTNALTTQHQASPTAVLLDETGMVGKLYGAKTTPHMFIIDQNGIIRYQGAIDSIASADADDIKDSDNYISLALDAIETGQEVKTTATKPYGCSVKY